jgi:hypothetical protein
MAAELNIEFFKNNIRTLPERVYGAKAFLASTGKYYTQTQRPSGKLWTEDTSGGGEYPYYSLVGFISQSGVPSPPELVILHNDLPQGNPSFSYNAAGDYDMTLVGAWATNKTWVMHSNNNSVNNRAAQFNVVSNDVINIQTARITTGVLQDDILSNQPIEIRVYK